MILTQKLVDEHVTIKKMLTALEEATNKLENGESINLALFEGAIDFIRNYADKFHHAKEEEILFNEMVKSGMPAKSSPIEVMLIEHDKGRGYVKGMVNAIIKMKLGQNEAEKELIHFARCYINLLREHIDKEDNILYPLAQRMLASKTDTLLIEFDAAEQKRGGQATVNKYEKIVADFERLISPCCSIKI